MSPPGTELYNRRKLRLGYFNQIARFNIFFARLVFILFVHKVFLTLKEYELFKRIAVSTALLFCTAIICTTALAGPANLAPQSGLDAASLALLNAAPSSERGMWLWNESDIATKAKQTRILDFSVKKKVTTIYLHSEGLLKNTPQLLENFINLAASRNIGVELLFGAPDWTFSQNHHIALAMVTRANAFVNSLPGARPVGLHFDVEPHALPGWASNQSSYSTQLLDLYVKLQKAKRPDMYLNADIAMGYAEVRLTRNGVSKPLSHWMVDTVDRTTLMAYRDYAQGPDSIISHSNTPINYAATIGKRAHIGVETTCNLQPEKITFCEEGNAAMQTALGSVVANYRSNAGFGGVAIHDYRAYLLLR